LAWPKLCRTVFAGQGNCPCNLSTLRLHMPTKVGKSSPLSDEVVDKDIIRRSRSSVEDCWMCQAVIAVRFRMGNAIDLNYPSFQLQSELLRQTPGKNMGYRIHPCRFNRMYRQQPGLP